MKKLSITEQTANKGNSIISERPKVSTTRNLLQGFVSNSWNGGYLKPIAFKKVMAGETIIDYSIKGSMRMLTPKAPPAQGLKTTLRAYFVPNSAVWKNWNKYLAQKGGSTVTKIKEIPHPVGMKLPEIYTSEGNNKRFRPITDSTIWRDSYISSYIPRIYTGESYLNTTSQELFNMPQVNWLPIRGFIKIYNEFLRHKALQRPIPEYNDDEVSWNEYYTSIPHIANLSEGEQINLVQKIVKGRKQDSYYTDWRTELEGEDNTVIPMYTDLAKHTEWQKRIAQSRSEANDEQMRDIDVVSKIRGSKILTEGRVQYLGSQTIQMNYSQVPQTAYNSDTTINEEFTALGQTGAFSYTEFDIPLINYHEFNEDGYIHVIAQTSADTIFENGLDRYALLNISIDDEYRPNLKTLKDDVIYEKEFYQNRNTETFNNIVGYKRKYSELFKLPNSINGDTTNNTIYEQIVAGEHGNAILTKDYYSFFENPNQYDYNKLSTYVYDNTDMMINKNQVIENNVIMLKNGSDITEQQSYVTGANQIFMLGITECIAELPVDDQIKNDYEQWSEV